MSKRLWPAAIALLSFSGFLTAQDIPTPASKVHIDSVRFEGVTRLSSAQRSQLSEDVQQLGELSTPGHWTALSASVEQAVQTAYADKGYWHAKVKAVVAPAEDLLNESEDGEVNVSIRAIDEGRSYRLRKLTWVGVSAFSESELAGLLPVSTGKSLERSKIAVGMETIRHLYLGGGYLSYVAVPQIEVNDHEGTADLRINVDEGGVFTVQNFDVVGLNPALRSRLLKAWPFKPGDVYRGENVENFLNANAGLLPAAASDDVVCRTVDLSNHTIEFVLDFRPQPLACNPQPEVRVTSQNLSGVESNP